MADKPGTQSQSQAHPPPATGAPPPPVDPKVALLEEIAARAVSEGKRDDPLIVRLQTLIAEMKGKAPA